MRFSYFIVIDFVAIAFADNGTEITSNPFSILAVAFDKLNLLATLYPKLKERFAMPE